MSYRKIVSKNRLCAAAIIVSALCSQISNAEFYLHPWTGHHESKRALTIAPSASYYTTGTNFDAVGQKIQPSSLLSYTRMTADAALSYGLSNAITAFGRVAWTRVQMDRTGLTGSTYGLPDQSAGLNWRAKEWPSGGAERGITLDFQVQLDFPAYGNTADSTGNLLFMGDGSFDITAGAFVGVPLGSFRATLGGGFTKRTEGFSSALPWSVWVERPARASAFFFGVGAYGMQSLNSDSTSAVIDDSVGTSGAGGSFFINAVNPTLIAARAQVGYQLSEATAFTIEGSYPVWGQAAPSGTNISVGMQLRLGRPHPVNPAKLSAEDYGKSNQGFVNYTFEGHVVRVNDRMNLVKIDKGSQDGIEAGQVYDIFVVRQDGKPGEAIARARVTSVKNSEAALTVTEYFKEVWIEEGFLVKRPLQ